MRMFQRLRPIAATGLTITAMVIACDEPELPAPLPKTAEVQFGVHDEDLFEIDGNPQNNAAVAGDDWGSILGSGIPTVDGSDATIFTGGSTKDDKDLSVWQHTDGNVPAKDDLQNAAATTRIKTTADGDELILYFSADRYAINGDAQIGFWFLQNEVVVADDGTFQDPDGNPAQHKIGDILILSNFTNGGAIGTIDVCHWAGADGPAGHIECDAHEIEPATGYPGVFCRTDDIACATINNTGIGSVWDFDPKQGPNNTYGVGAFFEGGVNATQLLGETPCFATFLVETRTSQSIDSVLKDFVLGELQVCAPSVDVCKQCDVELVQNEETNELVVEISVTGWACNTGNVTLEVDLVDDVAGDIFTDTDIAAESCVAFEKRYRPSSGDLDPNTASFSNEVTMTGTHPQAGSVTAEASATCAVCGDDTVCEDPPYVIPTP